MRIVFFLFFSVTCVQAQFSSSVSEVERKNPVKFTHVPFLLLRVNPSALVGYNNTFQFGAEIAPPVGKLSFAFDYGVGSGKWNLNKSVREHQGENKNKELRGEIRAYFSDWFPFYALDKKPFGRYYALEYVNGTYDRVLGVAAAPGLIQEQKFFTMQETQEKRHVLHVKFGRHIHLHRHLFLDVYGGIGAGKSSFTAGESKLEGELYSPVSLTFPSDKSYEKPQGARYFFSKTFGVRLVFPI